MINDLGDLTVEPGELILGDLFGCLFNVDLELVAAVS